MQTTLTFQKRLDSILLDGFPFVGDLTAYGRPNMFISAGFSGHGMPRIFSCSKYLSELIVGKEPTTSIPAPFMLSFERMSMETPYLDSLNVAVNKIYTFVSS
ncbi:hypothetical protein KL921_005415 [Ogataea angusta]|nr:hypothetical protein KL921_005415 [Ogataea angusta]